MSTLTTYVSAASMVSGFRQIQQPVKPKAPVHTPVPTEIAATPYWAWELYHGRRHDLPRVASKLGVSRSEVLRLIAEYKPTADVLAARRMARLQEPSIHQVADHPGLLATWKHCGEILSCRDPQVSDDGAVVSYWSRNSGRVMAGLDVGFPVSYHVDDAVRVSTLWVWQTGAQDQQASAFGIEARLHRTDLRLIDGSQRYRGNVGTVGAAIRAAATHLRAAAGLDD
jgi:hypothetical protein